MIQIVKIVTKIKLFVSNVKTTLVGIINILKKMNVKHLIKVLTIQNINV